jgi:galactose-1-phosphate uridylyltransferase
VFKGINGNLTLLVLQKRSDRVIAFEKTVKNSSILDPTRNFEESIRTFEYRTDPLTRRNTTVIKGMMEYVSKFLVSDDVLLNSLIEKTRVNCPFCPENVESKTPMFSENFVKGGRIFVGNIVVVPNFLGHAERSIVVVLSKEHHLKLNDFTSKMVFDGFKGGVTYLRRLKEVKPSIRFPAFIFNYMPPAGSSMLHPHVQVLVRDRPFYLVRLLLEKSKAYFESNGSNYWADLLEKERNGERYVFGKNDVEWLVPFAPLRGINEAQAIVRGKSNLLEMTNKEWLELAEGTAKILQYYHKEGYISFNIILMSGPVNEHLDYFDVNLRIMSRPGIQAFGFTDAWALPYLLWDGEAVEEPELFAQRLRAFVSSSQG